MNGARERLRMTQEPVSGIVRVSTQEELDIAIAMLCPYIDVVGNGDFKLAAHASTTVQFEGRGTLTLIDEAEAIISGNMTVHAYDNSFAHVTGQSLIFLHDSSAGWIDGSSQVFITGTRETSRGEFRARLADRSRVSSSGGSVLLTDSAIGFTSGEGKIVALQSSVVVTDGNPRVWLDDFATAVARENTQVVADGISHASLYDDATLRMMGPKATLKHAHPNSEIGIKHPDFATIVNKNEGPWVEGWTTTRSAPNIFETLTPQSQGHPIHVSPSFPDESDPYRLSDRPHISRVRFNEEDALDEGGATIRVTEAIVIESAPSLPQPPEFWFAIQNSKDQDS